MVKVIMIFDLEVVETSEKYCIRVAFVVSRASMLSGKGIRRGIYNSKDASVLFVFYCSIINYGDGPSRD